ncbi:dystonin-like isoform X23 [Acipenser ruthenus]|uniref:dystonin-like isoform X23 n=1 Tax=Acipenser ruthenus TaxID=7906 RepID=UPI002741DD87|nr:dystonin-like isoform X23 [Acipenser ruthenus]
MMIAAAFLVLLRPYSIQCVLLLLLLLLGTIATILFFCCWHRKLRKGKHPIKSVLSGRSRSRAGLRSHHFRSEGYRQSPRHARRSARARVAEETQPLVEIPESEQEAAVKKRKTKKRVQPEFYHSVQVTPTRKPSSGSGNASHRCSMSSSADFSDEDDFSQKSGSVSPALGDTLPWNLPRHERSKRKIQGGSILDPAERAVLRIADERDRVQKKTFAKWINQHLMKVRKHVNDLYEDLRDGHNLISLLEVLSGQTLPREKGRMRFHRLQNVQIALDYLKKRQVKLVNIRNDDITDGNPKLTLGLIWTIILHFQISDIHVPGVPGDMTAKEKLLLWSQQTTESYVGVRCENFTTCWRDGRLFNAIIHKYRPDLIDMNMVATQSSRSNLEQAFCVAEQLGVTRLLDPEDVDVQSPDEKSVITYVSILYDVFPKIPEGEEGITAHDVDIKWVEYQNMVNYLSQWIRHHLTIMSDRTFPNNPVELKALYNQYLQFKETEIPPKENDKTRIKHLYKLLESWIEFGRIKLPQEYHPNDVEREWGKLIIAMLEREKSLRPEVDRLEMLQQIASRVQRDCVAGEDKLVLARNALQSDAKRLESGIQFQNEAEIAGYLLECESLLRQQVVDIQILLDGKYYLADQLVQRVSKLRDDFLALKSECSSVYSRGRTLTTEQTKMMISGITQSLNSGFSQNMNPGLNTGLSQGLTPTLTSGLLPCLSPGLTSSFTSSLTPCLTPSLTPAMTPGLQPAMVQGYVTGMDSTALQSLKLMQIRKPLVKSSLADPNLTEEEVNMNFVQDLLNWVEEMQVQLDRSEWGSDLPTVETHLENHKSVHRAIEDFQMSLKEAKFSEIQMTSPHKYNYSERLSKLENQYGKLLNSSRNRQKYLESLHEFVSRATREIIWLNEKEEEEVAYDWSDRNSNMAKKRDYHADLMRELDEKERAIKSVQDMAERLLLENHPAKLTIEAYRAAMQTQWSWILQLCGCVEQHLKENAVYFEFFNDAKESMDYLNNLQDTIQRKYGCDRTSNLHKLEDLIKESMDEKEQLLQYRSTVASLVGRAKGIAQLKPRNPDGTIRCSIPVKAICDYRQIEITIFKEDECVLASNSYRAKWKVISPNGNEAMVPSVCFTIPPPNKEAIETVSRIEQLYQNVLTLWHHSHINMKSVVSWHYLMNDIEAIQNSNVASIKTMLPGEHQQVLSNLQSHFEDFLEDSQESEVFTVSDRGQLEREVVICKQYYEDLLKSAEREEHEESVYNLFISEVRNFRMRLENYEERLIRQIRAPLERDDLQESVLRIAEQEKSKKELDRLKEDLETMQEKCETFISQAASTPSVPTLSTELNVVVQNMNQVYSMSSIYLEKLKTVSRVVKNSQGAEALVRLYEAKLCEEDAVNAETKAIETVVSTLKLWCTEIDEKREVFHDLEDELQKARAISDRMFKMHNERDFDLDWHKEKADQLAERWQNVHSQIENRLRDLECTCKSLKYYKDTYHALDEWIKEMEDTQLKMQENQPEDSKALAELLNQQKVLVSEIEMKQSKIDECQKYSEQYSAVVKDYELQLMTYRAMVDSQQKSPVKRRRMQSSSDVIQEFMDLRTRYTALVTLMTQYVKFASETLKRTEEEEKSVEEEKKEHGEKVSKLLNWASNMKKTNIKEEKLLQDEKNVTKDTSYKPQVSMEEVATKKEQIAEALRTTQLMLVKHSDKMTEEERQDTKEQLKSLQQAYNDLSRQSVNQLPQPQSLPAEQDYQTIEGLIDLETGAVFSVCRSMQKGLIDYTTGINLLEAQLITSGLILPELSVCLDLDDAFKHGLVDKHTYNHLQEMNGAKRCILSAKYASEPLPLIAAWRDGIISEQLAIRMIEIQLATGGLRVTYTGDILNLEKAFQSGLIPPPLFLKILEREDTCTDLIDPNTAERVSLIQLVQRSLVHEETGLRLLPVKKGEDGKIALKSGREVSILRAVHEGLIDRETMFRLLGAQLFAGGIMDPTTNSKLNVKEAVQEGLIDQDTACKILSYQAQNGGIVNPCTGDRLTMDEAVQCNLITSSSALLVLEKQKAFMGLIWPCSGEIFTVSTSIQHEVITNELAYKLLSNRQKIAALYIPESSEVVSIEDATKSEIIDSNTADVLNSIVIPDVIPDIDDLDEKIATWVSSCDLQLVSSHESQQNQEISELKNTNLPSSSEAKQLFISYLMINSYMDPKLGQRLLVYDRELAKITTLFTENAEKSHNTMPCLKQSSVSLDKHDCNEAVENRVSEQSVGRHENRTDKEPNTMPNQHFPRQVQEQFISRLHDCFSEETESYKHSDNKTQVDNAEVYNTMNCSEDGVEKQTHISADRYVAVLPSITKDQSQIQFQTPNHHLITNANIEGQEHLCNQKHMIETGLDGPHTYKEIAMGSDTKETVLDGDFDMLPHMRECSLYKDVKCNSFASVSSDINDKVSKIPNDCESQKADLEFSGKTGIFTKGLGNDEEENLLLLKDVEKGKLEQQNAANILKVQLEECGILDYATGERYDLDTALEKGLVGKDTILDVLALQFQDGGINDEQTGETLPLKEDVAKGLIPSHVGLQIEEKLGLLDRFYESKTGETITINDAIQQGLVDNDVIEKALLSEKVIYATIDPESNDLHSVPEGAVFSLLNDSTAQRLLEGQVLSGGIVDLEQGKQVSVTLASKLGLINEQLGEGLLKTEEAITGKEVDDSIKLKQMGLQMELSGMQDPEVQQPLPLTEAIEKARVDKDTAPSILCKQLEDGGIVQHASGLCLSVGNALKHGLIDQNMVYELSKLENNICKNTTPETFENCSHEVSQEPAEFADGDKFSEHAVPYSDLINGSSIDMQSGKRYLDLKTCTEAEYTGQNVQLKKSGVDFESNIIQIGNQEHNESDRSSPSHDNKPSEPNTFKNTSSETEDTSSLCSSLNHTDYLKERVDSIKIETEMFMSHTSDSGSLIRKEKCKEENFMDAPAHSIHCYLNVAESVNTGFCQAEMDSLAERDRESTSDVSNDLVNASPSTQIKYEVQDNRDNLEVNTSMTEACTDPQVENGTEVKAFIVRNQYLQDDFKIRSDMSNHIQGGAMDQLLDSSEKTILRDSNDSVNSRVVTGDICTERKSMDANVDLSTQFTDSVGKLTVQSDISSITDSSASESVQTSDVCSKLRSSLQELVKITVEDTNAKVLQKAESQVAEDIIKMIISIQECPTEENAVSHDEEKGPQLSDIHDKSPDVFTDLLKQEFLHSKADEQLGAKKDLALKEKMHETNPAAAAELFQSQLQQVQLAASLNDDPAMFKELAGKLSDILGGNLECERNQTPGSARGDRSKQVAAAVNETLNSDEPEFCNLTETIKALSKQEKVEQVSADLCEDTQSPQNKTETKGEPKSNGATQHHLKCIGKLQDHSEVLELLKNKLDSLEPLGNNLDTLTIQLEESELLESQLSSLAGTLTKDLKTADQLLESANEYVPMQIRCDLEMVSKNVQLAFSDACKMSTERRHLVKDAIYSEKSKLAYSNQELLERVQKLSVCIEESAGSITNLDIMNTDDMETVELRIQQNKDLDKALSITKNQLDATAFDVQYFISEHAQDLSPTQSKLLLKSLNAAQKSFKELMEVVLTQQDTLMLHLEIRQDLSNQKNVAEKQKEYTEKLQELCHHLTQTENRLIGHQQTTISGDSLGDLQQFQTEHQALQRDVQAGDSALTEVVRCTKKFLEENRGKLQPEQIAMIENKLEEANSKSKLINQRAEESRKDLDKAMTTAIKQETEKVAAVKQLEESKNKIEGLLGWLSNVGKEKDMEGNVEQQVAKQNGNLPLESTDTLMIVEEDEANGNLQQVQTGTVVDGKGKATEELDLNKEYDKVKAHHQEILSQQPDFIIATQSAQALLEKQGHMLSPEEKEKLQRNIQELKDCYETTLTKTEHKMKQIHSVQEELQKFKTDCSEFENWLQQSEGEITDLKTGAPDLSVLNGKLQRQRSFSEDVISHKGDLRFITISGQRVLDAAKSCSKADTSKDSELDIDTSGVCTVVQDKLDSAANRYKTLHSQCNQLGNNLKDVVEKYKQYEDASTGLGSWLAKSEEVARKQLAEPVAADPKNLQKQLEETKALQGQMSGRQGAVEKLRKTADALTATEGDLLTNQDTIQETVDDIVERYDNLSKAVSDRNEKLQITLTRSLSVQDGLDEMLTWMEGVEKSLGEKDQVPLNSTAIQDILSKKAVLEQDFSIRQSSITAMKEKVKKFIETADPSTASSLQAKMDTLSKCFTDSCKKHKEKVTKLEELKDKVELFEKTAQKVQQFVAKRSQALSETDGPGKNVNELSQLIQDTNAELSDYAKDVELLRNLSKELAEASPEGSNVRILEKVDNLSKKFKEFEDTFKEKEEEVSSCQGQLAEFKCAVESFRKWLDESTEKIPVVKPACSVEDHQKHLLKAKALLEEWLSKASMLQEINNKGSALCNLISVLTSPVKTKTTVKSGTAVENDAETHAYLTNKELTVVQQNMSYVNHGYEILGVHLKENVGELDGMLVKLREVQDEANSLMQWFDDINKTTSSWDAVPTEAESMKTQMEQQKTFEAELKQKQGKLKQLKEKLLDLLEKHPDSPEAAKWKQMLNQIDSTWKDINSSVDERKQKLEESSKNLTQFQTAEAQLKQWLAEKELMMSVLGPLSIDPNMLNAQKQQVQILQNEFDTRKSQYHQLKESAQGILERPGDLPPSCKVLKDQLAAVAEKWENLTGRLSDRSEQIDQAIVKTNEFQNLLKKISENVDVLNSKLNSQSSLSTQPDAVKQQLETANEICTKLGEEKKNVEEAEVLCKELSALVCEEYLKTDLSRQLESVKKPFKDLEERTGNRIQQLNSAFASSQQFHQMSKDFHGWLDGKRQEHSMSPLISAELETLQQTIKEHAEFQKSLNEQNAAYEIIIKDGETLLQKTQGAEKSALQSQLALLKANWDELKKQSSERQDKLQGCLQRAQKYKQHVEKLRPWIEECENKVAKVKICIDPAEVERSISEVKTLQKDLDKHRGMVELLNTAADSLFEVSQADEDLIRDEKASFNQKVDNMTEQLQNKKDSLEEIAQRLKEFNESHKEAKEQLYGAKQQLEAHESLGAQAYSNKHLTNMKAQQKTLETLKTQVDYLKNLAQGLVVDAPDAAGVSDLLLQTDSLNQEYNSVNQQVEEKCSFLETKLQGIGQFQNNIREMFSQFADFDDELDSMQPVARDLDTLQSQKDDMKSFVNKLQELMVNTVNANKNCKKMLETEGSPDLLGLKRDLEALNKQCSKLMDRAKGREELVETTLIRVDELYKKIEELSEKLQVAKEHEESQGPVGMETEIINQQLDVFKVFQKEEIEPLQAKLQDVNWLGQGLIQSAAKNANTQALEGDLEDVTTRWNTLNKKVAERDTQLHEALLHCGRFQDALESLLSWLNDTEDLVANQKPPSAEFKVVKAQIQEQKLLQRLLDDRKPTVDIIKREGEKLSGAAEPADKEKMLKELGSLDHRWDALLSKAETRHRQLESILVVAQQFHETLEPLAEWLSATEKRLANSEPIGTQTKKLEQQISQHKALEDDIMGHSKNLHQAISLGQTLKTMSSMDDKELVQGKLDSTQTHAIEVQERCSRKAVMLQQALSNAQLFGEDEVALMNWLNEVHDKLSNVAVQDYNTDVLHKQHYEQLALHEDIVLRKQNVHLAIQNGLKLLKQTTGDEVVIIQEKLDGIKARYAEVNSMSTDVSKSLNQALTLATKLQQNHEELCSWLDNIEAEVAAYEVQVPAGEQLTQVQERQKELLKDAKEHKRLVDTLNEVSSALLELVPWRAREGLDKLVCEDNERYRLVSDSIMQHVEEIAAAILRSQQFEHAAEVELEWLTDAEKKLASLGDIRLEQDQTVAQLQVQKAFSIDILRHKDAIDEIVKTGEAIISSSDEEEKQSLQDKVQTLLEKYDAVSHINAERYLQLERAQSLASQFWETYDELWPWLQETRSVVSQLPAPAIEYETLKQQEEELRQMRELIAEHKPHIDKMNKTGPQLLELSPVEGLSIQEKYTVTDKLFMQIKEDVKQRAVALDEAISKSTQFHDKIDPMMETLGRIAERLRQPPSISVEVEKIREQISENKNVSVDLEKLQPGYETLKQRGEEMIARSEGADKDISAKAVQDKLDHMVFIWEDIQALLEEREAKLLDVMDLAEKFWFDHCALIVTIKDTQDLLRDLEEPGTDPSVVKQQQESVESFKEEIDGLQEELDVVQNLADELMAVCGEPDKPVIKKSIDELNSACDNLNKNWKERVEILEEAMQSAVQFQDGLQGLFDWVDIVESKLDSMSPVGTDLETVKQQIGELKEFKLEAYQLQIEMERLNQQAEMLLKKVVDENDRHPITEPLTELRMLWDSLDQKIINRQHKLEGALLALGQFQHALDELLTWLTHTEDSLKEQKKTGGDPKAIEIELAKHHVLQNDVLAHKTTVEAVEKAGNDMIESSAGEEASSLQSKLENLNQRWKTVLEKTGQRQQHLESALLQAQGFHGEIEDMQKWLKDTERQLLASKAVGGLPETAREQLNIHLELLNVFEAKEEQYISLMQKGQQLITICPEGHDANTEQDLKNLKEKWESVQTKTTERKVKLEEALTLATQFHNSLQDFINWLTQAEQTLTMATPASLILDDILFQIDEHKVFVTEVNCHREQIIELDKTGTHLKYFSQKQDVVLIKNLLISVQSRWEKVVQRSVERGRALDDARKRAKQFHEAWNKLMEWLEESEKALDSEQEIANDPDKIKMQLAQHKDFQKALGGKHSVFDTSIRTGRSLKEKTSLKDDNQKLDDMLSELRDKWDTVCGKSVERQNKLEEALLFSGHFTDALQALIDWLYKVEPQLAEDQPVHGDIDLVLNLIDNHKVFQKELGKRTSSVQALKRSARELTEISHDDSSWVKVQMQELSTRWETVCALSVSKQTRLEQALCQAEEFHSTVHILLEWLAEAEQSLRFHGALPDDEEALCALLDLHKEFMRKLEEKRVGLSKATGLGEVILTICHPDSITTIKHWNTIIKARFEEVLAWAKQHQHRLGSALKELLANRELLETLLGWLQWAETTLNEKDKETIPQQIEEVKTLIAEHQTFMEEMTRKQPNVDKLTKTYKRRGAAEPPPIQSNIPVLDKGRGRRKRSPMQRMYPSSTNTQIETKNPRVNLLVSKWQQVWLLALDRRRKLNDALDRLEELREFANFDFDIWRKRYMRWMNHKKSRVMDFFRRIDKDQDGKITRQEFIDGILSSKFPTSRLEMSAVADIFDRDGDGYIDYYEFVAALHPNKDAYKPLTDADKIEDEVTRQVAKCKCPKRFQVEQIGANKYRFFLGNQFGLVHCLHESLIVDETLANRDSQNVTPQLQVAVLESCILFGDSQQLRLVRILRSTVMVRVGGGWMALDEFLVKNDPCRVHHHGSKMLRSESNSSITTQSAIAKGRTNMELREKFILPEGVTQIIGSFRYRGHKSRPSSRAASPNRSNSSHCCVSVPPTPNLTTTSTPKNPHHITRNYDKPWLTNSKTSTPVRSSESPECQVSPTEGTPIQGSKLRLPGYLSGKGFHAGEESSLITAAASKARTQSAETKKTPSRPGSRAGSKAGSRASSRRGSDASDFDISEILSVCSDMSETVPDSNKTGPRAGHRPSSAKPSKIPTPQRRSPAASKLAKASKR